VKARLLDLLTEEDHRAQAAELLVALDDAVLWAMALAEAPIDTGNFRGQECTVVEPSWWPILDAAPGFRVERLLVTGVELDRLPDWADELIVDTCTVGDVATSARRLVLAGSRFTGPLPVLEELELYWPQQPVDIPAGCGHVRLTGQLEHNSELVIEAQRVTVLWAHACRSMSLRAARAEVVDCAALERLEVTGELSCVRAKGYEDRFPRTDLDAARVLASLHTSRGFHWPEWVGHGPELLQLGARWVCDWSDTDALLLEKQAAWEDMLGVFRHHPAAPMAAAESYIGAFGRSRVRAERFLNRVFHNPWGLNDRTFGRAAVPALAWLVEHPRCQHRELVRGTAERLVQG
jgi:hypothetical protein